MKKTPQDSQSKRPFYLIITLLSAIILLIGCGPSEKDVQKVYEEAMAQLRTHATSVEGKTMAVMNTAKKLSLSMGEINKGGDLSPQQINDMLKNTIEKNPDFMAAWVCLEQGALNPTEMHPRNHEGYDAAGRFVPCWRKINGKIQINLLKNYTKKGPGDYYLIPFNTGIEKVFNPVATEVGGKRRFKTIFAVPVRFGEKVVGVVGIDILLKEYFEPMVKKIQFYNIGYCFIVSNNSTMVAHPTKWSNVGKNLAFFAFRLDSIKAVAEGKEAIEIKTSKTTGRKAIYMFAPVQVSEHSAPWSLVGSIPFKYLRHKARQISPWWRKFG
jgi:methyl-accepting chemotaxis protein